MNNNVVTGSYFSSNEFQLYSSPATFSS